MEQEPSRLSKAELVVLVLGLQQQIEQLLAHVASLEAELEQLKASPQRAAAPFSKGHHKPFPKTPGRKPGEGTFNYRGAPPPETITEPLVSVPLRQSRCPQCGGALEAIGAETVYQTDLPPVIRPQVTAYRVAVCRCRECGAKVRGQHPEVAADQYGATAHRLGPRVLAAAHSLHYGVGLPVRKVPAVLAALSGIQLTQSALTQDALKKAEGTVGSAYEELRQEVAEAPQVHTDDTGWRVGGETAHLMVFETPTSTVYQIREQHRNEEVRELVPANYHGVMITDRGPSYDAHELRAVKQQKCLAHIQRSISAVVETKTGKARWYGQHLKGLLHQALELHRRRPAESVPATTAAPAHAKASAPAAPAPGVAPGTTLSAPEWTDRAQRLQAEVTHHLRDRNIQDPDNQRLNTQIGRHHDYDNLLRFLFEPDIEPTNNRAERALRPAVIARKVSQCSKNDRGAQAQAAFMSVVRTVCQRGQDTIQTLLQVFRTGSLKCSSP